MCAPVIAAGQGAASGGAGAGLAAAVAALADAARLELGLAAVGDARALLDGERVALVAPRARLRAVALGARVGAVAALSPGKRPRPLRHGGFRLQSG